MLRALPYAVGVFLLLPLVLWLVLATTTLQGPSFQAEAPLANALMATSLPLVLWFALSSLGSLANSMAGRSQFAAPAWAPVRWTLRLLPAVALLLGAAAGTYLVLAQGPTPAVLAPLAVAVVIAVSIRQGEAERPKGAGIGVPARRLSVQAGPPLAAVGRRLGRGLLALPLLGSMLRDAMRGSGNGLFYLGFNVAVLWLVALWFGGLMVVIWTALLATPAVFLALIALTEQSAAD